MLVIAAEPTDSNTTLPAIQQVLDFQGTPYTVFVASPRPSDPTADRLASMLSSGCRGFYQGVILGNGQVAYGDPSAGWQSALTDAEWQSLWNYERTFGIRQITWYTYPTAEYGFNPPTAGSSNPINAQYTAPGQATFSYANTTNPLTIKNVWVYQAAPLDSNTTPLLQDSSGHALGAVRTYLDGTQNLALTFDSNAFVTHNLVLSYGLVNWVTQELFLGERHIFLAPQVDDLLIDAHVWSEGTPCGSDPEQIPALYRMTGDDLQAVIDWQSSRQAQPTTGGFRLDLAFNGEGATGIYDPDTLTPAAVANQGLFKWINHTFTHDNLDNAGHNKAFSEISQNNRAAQDLGFTTYSTQNLVTPDVSGLDNPQVMQAAFDAGVRYVVSDSSRPGYGNPAPNLGLYNQHQPGILMLPRRPNNLFYNVTNPQQWTEEYNCFNRSFWGRDLTYPEILENESQVLLGYVLRGDMDPWMFHETNLRAYDGTHTLLGDLLDRVLDKYDGLFLLPVLSLTMDDLGMRMANRMAYSGAGVTASVVPGESITISSQQQAIVPVTGLQIGGVESYGGQYISHLALNAGETVTISLTNRPPTADSDFDSVAENTPLNVAAPGVLGNDTDPDGDLLTAVLATGPANGTLTLDPDGAFSYTPQTNFNGTDSFTYRAKDPSGAQSSPATVTITVTPVNGAPVALNNSYTANEDTPLNVAAPGVLGNDTDPDGDPLTAVLATGPANGTLTLNTNGSFAYTPQINFSGGDSFTYRAKDPSGAQSSPATVTITVTPGNDAPVANNDSYTMRALDILLVVPAPGVLGNDTDPDGDPLTAVLVTGPSRGVLILNANGRFSYTPVTSLLSFTDSFTYRARDGAANSNVTTVTIRVNVP